MALWLTTQGPIDSNEEQEEIWDNLTATMTAQCLFHNKKPEDNTEMSQYITKVYTKRQGIQAAKDKQEDMLAWTPTQWGKFYINLKAVPSKISIQACNISQKLAQENAKKK
jgi:hypothetical protein